MVAMVMKSDAIEITDAMVICPILDQIASYSDQIKAQSQFQISPLPLPLLLYIAL